MRDERLWYIAKSVVNIKVFAAESKNPIFSKSLCFCLQKLPAYDELVYPITINKF